MSKPESVLGFRHSHIWRTLIHEICCKHCLGKGRIRARGWQNFGAWWLYNHLWYAIAAKLLSGDKRFKLPIEFETERPNPKRVDLRILSGCFWPSWRVRGKTLQPGKCLWFLFFPPSGRRKRWNISKGELKKIIGCQGNRENGEWKSRWSTGHFSSSETLLRV